MFLKIIEKARTLEFILGALFCIIIGGFFVLPTSPHRVVLYALFLAGVLFIRREKYWSYATDYKNSVLFCTLLFLLYALISNIWSEISEFDRLFQQIKPALFIALFMIICSAYLRGRLGVLSLWIEVYILCAVVTSFVLILWHIGNIYEAYFINVEKWRMDGLGRVENPNQAGLFYGIALLNLFFLKPVYLRVFENRYFKIVCAICLLLMFFLTLSRGAFVAFLGTAIVLGFINMYASGFRAKVLALPLLSGALSMVLVMFVFPHLFTYMVERGTTGRLDLWQMAFSQFLERPIIGHGAGTKFYYNLEIAPGRNFIAGHVHNLYLSVLVHFGLIGFFLFVSLLTLVFWGLVKYVKETGDYSWMIFYIYGCVFGLIDFGGHYNSLSSSWMVFWMPIAVLVAYQKQKKIQI